MNEIDIGTNIKARAVAREFDRHAQPRMVAGKYQHDQNNHLVMELDDKIIEPIREIGNANMFVTQGKAWLGDVMIGVKSTELTHVAVGSGTTAPAAGDTDVETIIGARHVYTDRFRSSAVVTLSTYFSSTENNGTWGNAGVFTDVSAGDMFCHSTFASPVAKSASNTQVVDFDITIS